MIDFLRYRYICLAVSLLLFLVGIGAYIIRGGFKYHIDFVGGAELRISFQDPINASDLRSAISQKGWKDAVIQSIGTSDKSFLIRLSEQNFENLEEKFTADIQDSIKSNKMTVENVDKVGAEVGKDMRWNAFISILLSLLLILLYVTIRSKYAYAIGAVVALAHDLLAVLVFLLLFNVPISLSILAAILTILGYSINDTIVIFSRIRENVKKMQGADIDNIVNTSINQTMRRTMLTSFSTLLALLAFFFFGGEALRGFSFTMIIGVIVGTYSSVYIASPVMMVIGVSSKKKEI